MLCHSDPTFPVEIHTDAIGVGVDFVLLQQTSEGEATIAKVSKTLNPAPGNCSATEMELFAVVFAIEKFQQHLSGNVSFKVVTDHAAITPLLKTRNPV